MVAASQEVQNSAYRLASRYISLVIGKITKETNFGHFWKDEADKLNEAAQRLFLR